MRASREDALKETQNITEKLRGSEGREAFLERWREARLAAGLGLCQPPNGPAADTALKHLSVPVRCLISPAIICNFTQPIIVEPILENNVLKNNTHSNIYIAFYHFLSILAKLNGNFI